MRILNMSTFPQPFREKFSFGVVCLIAFLGSLVFGFMQPAYAGNTQTESQYISADGTDLTAVAQCLPKKLSQPNLDLALKESGDDFLQKVFNTKDSYDDYKVEPVESEFLNCLQSKGVTPVVLR